MKAKAVLRKVRPDSKGRITLGQLAEGVSSYIVRTQEDGKITLEPLAEVPARERWLYEDREALESVKAGLEDAKAGRVTRMSFKKYLKSR
jgi:hypothetical protein